MKKENILDNETAYLTDYTAFRRVSLNKFVVTRGHSVSSVIDSLSIVPWVELIHATTNVTLIIATKKPWKIGSKKVVYNSIHASY